MRVKLALAPKMGREVVVEEVELDEPGEYDVRIKVMTCTICHSDIHANTGEHMEYEGPGAAGHEISGIVDAIGSKVTYVKPGDRVLCSEVRAGCGHCDQCLHDRPWFCTTIKPMSFRVASAFTRLNGERVTQTCSGAAGFATYCNAYENMLVKLDDDIPFEIGSALACGFMSGFGAVLNRSKPKPGESYAVVGCGGVGLSAIMGARLCGCVPIIAIDTQQIKLDAAIKFGATHTINPKEVDVVEAVKAITGGFGVDHSLVGVAGNGIKRTTFDLTAGYGQMVIVGHGHPRDEMMGDVNYMEFLSGKRVTGSVMGAVTLRRDIPKYMDMYRQGMIDIDALLTNWFPLDRIQEALDDSERGALKNVVVCDDEYYRERCGK
ncbi:MAG: alcohol dehydrogenase catalytic domain-containing protein [Oscillospiraceae bacterium]|jgi:Zn-dependent alcohol dehydrogenase|nr:alcohol dehydrogenase catalytic domain-containing protein [Oscillospiraceae bacterium]